MAQPSRHRVDRDAAGQLVAGGRVAQGVVGAPPLRADEVQTLGGGEGLLGTPVGRGQAQSAEEGPSLTMPT